MTAKSEIRKLSIEGPHALALFREMVRVRRFEEKCVELYALIDAAGY